MSTEVGDLGLGQLSLAEPPPPARQDAAVRDLPSLIERLQNPRQQDILRRLLVRDDAGSLLYLVDYAATGATGRRSTTPSRPVAQGVFTVLGAMKTNGVREEYSVRLFPPGTPKGTFWCSCPDHKFNSSRNGTVCKHISFIVCRVAKVLDWRFFETKELDAGQYEDLVRKATAGELGSFTTGTPLPPAPIRRSGGLRTHAEIRAQFTVLRKPVDPEDVCPICFDSMVLDPLLSCPKCSNNVHLRCMEVWLERHSTCVFCRNEVWSEYNCY